MPDMRELHSASLSPDGTRVAGVKAEGLRTDIWVADVQRGTATRLTHSGTNSSPIWSADGRSIYYASRTDGPFEIWSRSRRAKPATRVFASDVMLFRWRLRQTVRCWPFSGHRKAPRGHLGRWPPGRGDRRRSARRSCRDPSTSTRCFSPDSKLVAFESADTGRWEVYVQRLGDGRRVVVSTDGGERPIWRNDGLFFQSRGRS